MSGVYAPDDVEGHWSSEGGGYYCLSSAERPFKSVDDLKKVPGIGDKLLAQLKDQVTVGK
jgi:Helix-hairpin-helix motif